MSVMTDFRHEWREIEEETYLYVRPRERYVAGKAWAGFFAKELEGYSDPQLLTLLDVVGVEADIGIEGFRQIARTAKELGLAHIYVAVLQADPSYPFLADRFQGIAEEFGLDFHVQICFERHSAETWFGEV